MFAKKCSLAGEATIFVCKLEALTGFGSFELCGFVVELFGFCAILERLRFSGMLGDIVVIEV